jgi:hypothetical protein
MKFKNENEKFEWDILDLNEKKYIQKIALLKPFQMENNNLFDYLDAREKWNDSTFNKQFKEKILNSLVILEKENFEYLDIIEIYKTLSSISTHIFIELEYYETDRNKLKEFYKVSEIFLNNYSKLLNVFSEIIITPNILNKYKKVIEESLNYFKDF